ncbi:DUF1232 domain-containing protein [Cyanobacterium stanieri LEGE 03274]|uniref:DUF1232 domain-containing protein n=2 Tax=Cyanobacterium stanieri TaxID=102235 RepID=K9YQ11_CYASC|nr:DUF1232 domain-containing protein [Cyanobacterium stanieri]AFZ48557.1 protein of unknown function DUF1232 [Cyanobacterium stanieri PCC 7202]MBE9221399.1 DUF1232 domain-containing protein [Cyanobacterium stanieri LEGE 03274]
MKFNLSSLYTWYTNGIRNPQYRLWVILGTLVYLISPIDISPDIIPIAGQIDDFVIVSIMLSEVSQLLLGAMKNKKLDKDNIDNGNSDSQGETVEVEAIPLDK